jgi:predicted ATPase
MLKKLILENWKSFRYAELYFDPLTVLIGTNASGKSNVVEALEFLRRMATGETVDVALNGDRALPPIRGGSNFIVNRNNLQNNQFILSSVVGTNNLTKEIIYSARFYVESKTLTSLDDFVEVEVEEVLSLHDINGDNELIKSSLQPRSYLMNIIIPIPSNLNLNVFKNFYRLYDSYDNFKDNFDHEIDAKLEYLQILEADNKSRENLIKDMYEDYLDNMYWQIIYSQEIKHIFSSFFIINPIPSQMRDFSRLSQTLEQDTSNIAGFLAALPDKKKLEVESTLSHYLEHFPEGDIKKIWAEKIGRLGTDAMLYCQEEWQPGQITEIDARSMSDGTLRFIGILTALLTRPEGSLIVIEEIDNGLHPSRAELLVRTLREIGTKRKIDLLITTHNPALLDALGPEIVPFVVVAHRDSETGESKLTQLEDIENLPKLLASGTLGKLATKGSIEKSLAESV